MLNLARSLVTLGRDGIDLIDENNGGGVLFSLLEGAAEIRLSLASHLGHDLGTVDKEEESTGLVGNSLGHERLSGPGRAVQQNTTRGLDTEHLEELGMTERKLDHLTDLTHLLLAATDVIVTDIVGALLIFALDRLTLAMNGGIRSNDAVLSGVDGDHLELDRAETTADEEEITLADLTKLKKY